MNNYFCMLFKELKLVEEARYLLVLHWNCSITIAVFDPDCILVCLTTARHKFLELGLNSTMLCHNIIQVPP